MGFKDTELGKIPLEWELCELKDKVNIVMGQSPKSEFYNKNKEGVPFMQGRTTFGDKYHEIDTWCTEPKRFANKADVLMSVRAPVGDVNIATMKLCIGRGLASLSMKNNNNEYLYYLLKNYVDVITSKGSGTVFSSVNKNDVETLKLPFAGDIEQKAIANILSSLDEKIELNNQMNKTLEEMAQALFKRWFVDFEFPNENGEPYKSSGGEMVDSELGMIPRGWTVDILEEISDFKYGKMPKKEDMVEKGFPIFSGYKITGYHKHSMFEKEQLIVVARGVGGTGDVKFTPEQCFLTNLSIAILFKKEVMKEYLYYTLRSMDLRALDTGSAQSQITINNLAKVKLIIPLGTIVNKFHLMAESLRESQKELIRQNNNVSNIRDTLLPKLMSGEIRVSDLQN